MSNLALCTIATNSYLAHASALVYSFLEHYHHGRAFLLLLEDASAHDLPRDERLQIVAPDELGLAHFRADAFRWNTHDLCRVLRPALLSHLLTSSGCTKLCYLDADSLVYSEMVELAAALDGNAIVLAPRLLAPLAQDGAPLDETSVLASGIYDPSFVAVSAVAEGLSFLAQWQDRLRFDPSAGQRWLDAAPAIFAGVRVLRRQGYCLSASNLGQRVVAAPPSGAISGYTAGGELLRHAHFGGIFPPAAEALILSEGSAAAALWRDHQERLAANRHRRGARSASRPGPPCPPETW